MHRQPIFDHLPDPKLPVTDAAYSRMLSLPFHSRLTRSDLGEIAAALRNELGRS